MTPHALVMGHNPRMLEESMLQTLGAQPASWDLARNGPDFMQSPKNYRDVHLPAMGVSLDLDRAMRGHLIDVSAEKAFPFYSCYKNSKNRPGGTEKFLVKFLLTFRVLRVRLR